MPPRATAITVLRGLLGERALIVVSNREPYVHRRTGGEIVVERPAGGLVAALDPVLQAAGGTWIAWGSGDADGEAVDAAGRVRVPPDRPSYTLRRVALSRAEVDGYYYGYANQALWPLCHMAMEHARFRRRSWELYQSANRRFADAVLEEAGADPLIWVHDYHLALVPRLLRVARADLFVMHFWHIPWPAWDIFRACPQRTELLEGLLGADLVAFQHPRHVEHFLECAERELGAQVDRAEGLIDYDDHVTHVEALPISVDFEALDAAARSPQGDRWAARLRRRLRLEGRSVILGVDRLDYTKGIPERLRALDRFFQTHHEARGRLVFVQKSAPSRTQIKAYRDLQHRVEAEIARLNTTYGTADWHPVVYLPRPLPPAGMAALYRMADVCVVSSLQDGMNLVAKEYVACQVEQDGVLVLSEMAGARTELSWAVPINPYDADQCAEALAEALQMPVQERRERMAHLRAVVAEYDIYRWMERHLRAAADLLAARSATRWVLEHGGEIREMLRGKNALALLVDFDGTLAPIVPAPEHAAIPREVETPLRRLGDRNRVLVGVISGRSLDDIRHRVGIPGIVYAGNHGLEIAGPEWTWTMEQAGAARESVRAAVRRLRQRLRSVPGVIIEDKGLTASVHFRQTPPSRLEHVRQAVLEEGGGAALTIRQGKRVFELRPTIPWDKGSAVRWILHRAFGDRWREDVMVIYIGDDRTDEDVFQALPEPAVTVKVAAYPEVTAARYAARDVREVAVFLADLARWAAEG